MTGIFLTALVCLRYSQTRREVFSDDPKAARSVARYFSHFLTFFEFDPADRTELCRLCSDSVVPMGEEGEGGVGSGERARL